MLLDITTVINGEVAEITLAGELHAAVADRFQSEIERVAAGKPARLVLHVRELTYIASIFLRILLVAKQPRGAAMTIYMVAPQEPVLDTLRRTGLDRSVVIV